MIIKVVCLVLIGAFTLAVGYPIASFMRKFNIFKSKSDKLKDEV